VTFCGLVPHKDVVNYYHNADIFINPSFYETLGMSTIEAMASGLPVITTPVGGVPEVVEHGKTGLLVKPGDTDELVKAIIRVLEDKDLRLLMGQAARKRAVELFSWERIC
jgi:glycosyltransferase involved in cell wall biosynthesis